MNIYIEHVHEKSVEKANFGSTNLIEVKRMLE